MGQLKSMRVFLSLLFTVKKRQAGPKQRDVEINKKISSGNMENQVILDILVKFATSIFIKYYLVYEGSAQTKSLYEYSTIYIAQVDSLPDSSKMDLRERFKRFVIPAKKRSGDPFTLSISLFSDRLLLRVSYLSFAPHGFGRFD